MITTVTVNAAIDKTYIVENFSTGGVFRVKQVLAQAGGKGLNVARVIKALGEEVVATGFVGGYNGRFIVENLQHDGIPSDFITIEGESRICLNILDPTGCTQTELLEPGPEVSPEAGKRLKEKIKVLARRSQVVIMSGSLARGLPDDYYAQLIEIAHREGARVVLDTSGRALVEGLKARPYMVKPNLQEAENLEGKPLCSEAAKQEFLRRLLQVGVEVAVLSLGGEGALIATGDNFFQAIPPKLQAVNTVGCGDAFVAGFAVALVRGQDICDAVRLATAIAAASAVTFETGRYKWEKVAEILTGICFRPLEVQCKLKNTH